MSPITAADQEALDPALLSCAALPADGVLQVRLRAASVTLSSHVRHLGGWGEGVGLRGVPACNAEYSSVPS